MIMEFKSNVGCSFILFAWMEVRRGMQDVQVSRCSADFALYGIADKLYPHWGSGRMLLTSLAAEPQV